jgi:hypothetical protein
MRSHHEDWPFYCVAKSCDCPHYVEPKKLHWKDNEQLGREHGEEQDEGIKKERQREKHGQ